MSAYPPQQGGVPPYTPPPYQPQGPAYNPMAGSATPAYATFWIRFAAVLIDGLIVGIPLNIILFALGILGNIVSALLSIVVYLLYEGLLLTYRNGQTIGKQLLNIRV